jgi:hypothetical protein
VLVTDTDSPAGVRRELAARGVLVHVAERLETL